MKAIFHLMAGGVLLLACAAKAADIVPIDEEPQHRLKFQNQHVRLFDVLLPSLESFNMGRAIIRESPLPLWEFGGYVLTVLGYSLIYTTIALLVGLLLFEDRDLA